MGDVVRVRVQREGENEALVVVGGHGKTSRRASSTRVPRGWRGRDANFRSAIASRECLCSRIRFEECHHA
jgi:hypothetical protein